MMHYNVPSMRSADLSFQPRISSVQTLMSDMCFFMSDRVIGGFNHNHTLINCFVNGDFVFGCCRKNKEQQHIYGEY
tara:strand:- start:7967 stop:8194 length:228 start_codon:yes stop_codon:yes gene_type:complete